MVGPDLRVVARLRYPYLLLRAQTSALLLALVALRSTTSLT
jgi:hypothetical protein